MILFLFAFFLAAPAFGQASWRVPAAPPPPPPAAAPAAPSPPPRPSVRVVRDTVVRVDTLRLVDTVEAPPPAFYIYSVYYEAVDRRLAMRPGFEWSWEKTAQRTVLQSSDTTLLSLGKESLRSLGYTYNDRGDRTENVEKIIEGLEMRVSGASAHVSYRVDASLLSLQGRFDVHGLLQLSSDFERRRYFLYFIPVDFLFGSEKYTLFLRVEKRGVNL